MTKPTANQPSELRRKIAVIDGQGSSATVSLYYDDDECTEIPWPSDWPNTVNVAFLQREGYEVRIA